LAGALFQPLDAVLVGVDGARELLAEGFDGDGFGGLPFACGGARQAVEALVEGVQVLEERVFFQRRSIRSSRRTSSMRRSSVRQRSRSRVTMRVSMAALNSIGTPITR
jgi:hypothetical protein